MVDDGVHPLWDIVDGRAHGRISEVFGLWLVRMRVGPGNRLNWCRVRDGEWMGESQWSIDGLCRFFSAAIRAIRPGLFPPNRGRRGKRNWDPRNRADRP